MIVIFESDYRRKALESWEIEKEEAKKEWKHILEQNYHLKHNPLKYLLTLLVAFFTQH